MKLQMRKQLKLDSKTLSLNYFTYQLVWFLSTFCCCFIKLCRFERKDTWYRRSLIAKKRLDLAILKLNSELSIFHYI